MDALEFLQMQSAAELKAFCAKAGTNRAYFSQIAHGHRRPSPEMCRRLEAASNHQLTRAELRPDIYGDLELASHRDRADGAARKDVKIARGAR